MTPTTIILCRHGESEGNRDARFGGHGPTPLTERGRAQAAATGAALARLGADAIYSSDLIRAQQTAQLIAEPLGLAVESTPALRERSVGMFTGLSFEEARARFPNDYAALLQREPDACPPGGETYLQCRDRAVLFVEHAMSQHAGKRIVLVSHHLTLYQLLLHVFGVDRNQREPRFYVRIDNCSLHRIERYDDGVWQVLSLNDCAHLETLASGAAARSVPPE
jgi:probable phosphoglycerate mutase